jgi:hypothetical protein
MRICVFWCTIGLLAFTFLAKRLSFETNFCVVWAIRMTEIGSKLSLYLYSPQNHFLLPRRKLSWKCRTQKFLSGSLPSSRGRSKMKWKVLEKVLRLPAFTSYSTSLLWAQYHFLLLHTSLYHVTLSRHSIWLLWSSSLFSFHRCIFAI